MIANAIVTTDSDNAQIIITEQQGFHFLNLSQYTQFNCRQRKVSNKFTFLVLIAPICIVYSCTKSTGFGGTMVGLNYTQINSIKHMPWFALYSVYGLSLWLWVVVLIASHASHTYHIINTNRSYLHVFPCCSALLHGFAYREGIHLRKQGIVLCA